MEKTKKCTKCGKELPLTEFGKHPNMTDGHVNVCKQCCSQYFKTPIGRAYRLIGNYNTIDRKKGRGLGNLTAKWVVENILFQPCAHCGIEDWKVIGCNRLDNSKPHTMDNVEPCCKKCNLKLAAKDSVMYQKQFNRFKLK